MQNQKSNFNNNRLRVEYNKDLSCAKLTWISPASKTQYPSKTTQIIRVQYWVQDNTAENQQTQLPEDLEKLAKLSFAHVFSSSPTQEHSDWDMTMSDSQALYVLPEYNRLFLN